MKYKSMLLIILAIILVSNISFAEKENLDSLVGAINNSSNQGISKLLGSNNMIIGLSSDMLDVARYIVITVLLISLLRLYLDFQAAADSPEMKAGIKSKALSRTIGILFCVNFWSIYKFISAIASNIF